MIKTAKGIKCLLPDHSEKLLTSGLFVFHRLFCLHRNQSSNTLAFTTTAVEDTHLTPFCEVAQLKMFIQQSIFLLPSISI